MQSARRLTKKFARFQSRPRIGVTRNRSVLRAKSFILQQLRASEILLQYQFNSQRLDKQIALIYYWNLVYFRKLSLEVKDF